MCVFGVDYRFGFNGMQRDDELKGEGNSLDFGARIYDSRLGKFLSLDQFQRLSTGVSLYSFADNSPLLFIDKDGNYKFPAGSTFEKDYPILTNYLKDNISEVLKNPKVLDALSKYGQMSKSDVATALKWGNGPTINITHLSGANGEFTPTSGSSEIRIDKGIADALESALSQDKQANLLLVVSTILHETTHFGDNKDGVDYAGEEGQQFEEAVYGMDIDNVSDAKSVIAKKDKSIPIPTVGSPKSSNQKTTNSNSVYQVTATDAYPVQEKDDNCIDEECK
jgi:RHS repeat-associated protein